MTLLNAEPNATVALSPCPIDIPPSETSAFLTAEVRSFHPGNRVDFFLCSDAAKIDQAHCSEAGLVVDLDGAGNAGTFITFSPSTTAGTPPSPCNGSQCVVAVVEYRPDGTAGIEGVHPVSWAS